MVRLKVRDLNSERARRLVVFHQLREMKGVRAVCLCWRVCGSGVYPCAMEDSHSLLLPPKRFGWLACLLACGATSLLLCQRRNLALVA